MSVLEWVSLGVTVWIILAAFCLCLLAAGSKADDAMEEAIERWERERRA